MSMRLTGLHHITMITADAPANVEFYADVLGLRLVKQTVNFDAPDVYHLYYGDELGSPGTLLTWFEFPGAAAGRAGAGMVHLIQLAVPSSESLEFWVRRLEGRGHDVQADEAAVRSADYDGLAFELIVAAGGEAPPAHPEIPSEHAIHRLAGARAYAPARGWTGSDSLLVQTLGFSAHDGAYALGDAGHEFRWRYDDPPDERPQQGAGTVHHIAWASEDADHPGWRERLMSAGARPTEIIDRDYFRSIYFREPSHVLFEIATLGPGFAVDEDPEHLGESLRLPHQHERLRDHLEQLLTPLRNPRTR